MEFTNVLPETPGGVDCYFGTMEKLLNVGLSHTEQVMWKVGRRSGLLERQMGAEH
jgi:hypothetical protein